MVLWVKPMQESSVGNKNLKAPIPLLTICQKMVADLLVKDAKSLNYNLDSLPEGIKEIIIDALFKYHSDVVQKLLSRNAIDSFNTYSIYQSYYAPYGLYGWGNTRYSNFVVTPIPNTYNALIYDKRTGEQIHELKGHSDHIRVCILSNDDKLAITASWDNTVKIWDIKTGHCISTFVAHTRPIESIAVAVSLNNKLIVIGSYDGTTRIWDMISGECIGIIEDKHGSSRLISISNDNTLVAIASRRRVKIWDIVASKCIREFDYRPKGKLIICHMVTGQIISKHSLKKIHVNSMVISPDNKFIVAVLSNWSAKVFDIESGLCKFTLYTKNPITSLSISPNNGAIVIASGSVDERWKNRNAHVEIYDSQTGVLICTLLGHKDIVDSIEVTPDNCYVITGCSDFNTRLFATPFIENRFNILNEIQVHKKSNCILI